MASEAHDIEVDLIILGVRGKGLMVERTGDGFEAVVLDKADHQRLAAERPRFSAKTISEVTQRARQAVERGDA